MSSPLLEPPRGFRWLVLAVISLPMFGNYYIYDCINPLTDIFQQQLGLTDEQIGWLNSSYSVAAVLTLFVGGLVIDCIGAKKAIMLYALICLVAAWLGAVSDGFPMMVTGRTVLGLGAESLIVAVTVSLARWFKGKELSFAFGVNLLIARLASVCADNSSSWAHAVFYPNGPDAPASWSGPLWIAVGAGAIGVLSAAVYWWMEDHAGRKYALGSAGSMDTLEFGRGMFRYGKSYWFIVGLCFTFYSAIFPFRTFANKFFQHVHFGDLAPGDANSMAGFFAGLLPLSAMFATPLFGLLVDKVGRRALFMFCGSVLLMPVYLLMLDADISLWVPSVMMGVAFSLIPAVMWPSVAYIVEERRLGTAYALMSLIQQIGFFAINWLIGWANTHQGASAANPGGYALGMYIFSALSVLGLVFSFLLRRSETGPGGHGLETIRAGSRSMAS